MSVQDESMEETENKEIKKVLEALLFASQEPLSSKKLRDIVSIKYSCDKNKIKTLLDEMKQAWEKQERSIEIEELAGGYLLRTKEEFCDFLTHLFHGKRPDRISYAASEVLAIIAYKQPVTRQQVEEIRGVDCSSHIHGLLERDLIEPQGRLEVPGRPSLYGVTEKFLKHYGLKDIKDLPPITFNEKDKKTPLKKSHS